MTTLLGSTSRAPGSGGAQLTKTMLDGLNVAIEREAVETRTGALPYRRGRLEHAYMSVAAGEAVMRFANILSPGDAAELHSNAESRNGRDDRSQMIGCDACDGWYHPDCLTRPPDAEDDEDTPWVCPPCVLVGDEDEDVDDE